MSSAYSLVNIIPVVLYFLLILIAGFDTKNKHDVSFESTDFRGKVNPLILSSIYIAFLLPLIFFLFSKSIPKYNVFILLFLAVLGSHFLVYRLLKVNSEKGEFLNNFKESTIFRSYLLISEFGIKLPLIIIFYSHIFTYFFGDFTFIILVILITLSGLVLISSGFSAYYRIGILSGFVFIVSIVVLILYCQLPGNLFIVSHLSDQPFVHIGWYFPLVLILAGSAFLELIMIDIHMMEARGNMHRNSLVKSTVIISGLIIFIVVSIGLKSHFVSFERLILLSGIKSKTLVLLITIGPMLMGIMSVFRTSSAIISDFFINQRSESSSPNIKVLYRRLVIVALVALTILLLPIINELSLNAFQLYFFLYLSLSIPVVMISGFCFTQNIPSNRTIWISMVLGWIPSVIILIGHFSSKSIGIFPIYILMMQVPYSFVCTTLTRIIVDDTLIKNKILFRKAERP